MSTTEGKDIVSHENGPTEMIPSGYFKVAAAFNLAIDNLVNAGWIADSLPLFQGPCNGVTGTGGDGRTCGLAAAAAGGFDHLWVIQLHGQRVPGVLARSELVGDGHTADLVGDNTDGDMYDNYNEGWPGYFIGSVDSFVGAPLGKWRPNVITMMLGTNDMDHGTAANGNDPAGAPGRLGTIIDDIFTKAPDTTLLVATLTPSTQADVEARIQTFNQQVPGVVAARAAQGKHVALVDMSAVTVGDIGTDPANWLHPHDSGYQKMADAFHQAIQNAVSNGWVSTPIDCSQIGGGCGDPAITAGSEPVGTDPNPVPSSVGGKPAASGGVGGGSSTAGVNQKVRYADFDGDGKADYIVVSDTGGLTVWYNRGGNGNGGFDGPHEVALGLAPGSEVQLADFDGDGRVDYIVVLPSGEVTVQLNRGGDGNGGWLDLGHVANGTGPASQTRFADIDGDGKADYLQVSPSGAVTLWINNGGDGRGGWGCACLIANGVAASDNIQSADFDGDGKADYIVVADDGSVDVWLNKGGNGNGGWQETGKIANGVAPGNQVIFADFDGDGRADYLVVQQATGETEAWLNRGGDGLSLTGWVPQGYIALGVGAAGNQVVFADLNGDHRADYLVVDDPSTGQYDAWLNAGTTPYTWNAQGTIAYGVGKNATDQVLFGDVNGDGTADYMVIPFPGTTGKANFWASNYGIDNSWTWHDYPKLAFQPVSNGIDGKVDRTVLVPLTNSGRADLATIYGAGGAVTAMFNQFVLPTTDGTAPPIFTTDNPQTPYNVATGVGYPGNQVWLADFDGDGKADYIVVDNTGAVQVYLNESGGGVWTWSPPIRVPGRIDCKAPGFTTPDFNYTQFADIDGDGRADYLCIERDNGAVRAWKNVDLNHGSTTGWTPLGVVANGVGVQ